jgi:basic amino acid/polyamine antiporter, APA family
MADTASPLERAARAFTPPGVGLAVAIGATTAMLGVLLSQIFGISRMFFAMGRRGDLPAALNHVHPAHAIPDRGIFVTSFFLVLVALFGTLEFIVAAAAFTILLYYSIANLAAMRMNPEDRLFPAWVPVCGLISCLVLAATLPLTVIASGLGLLVAGFLVRWLSRQFNERQAA